MQQFAEFQIIGRVGNVKTVGSTLRVSIAADYGRRDKRGVYQSNPFWNEVTIFNENTITWVKNNVVTGDLVHARGTLRQTEWETDEGIRYGMTLAVDKFDDFSFAERQRLANKQQDDTV